MDATKCKAMLPKIEEALSLLEKDFGAKFRVAKSIKYDDHTATFKLEVLEEVNGTVVTPEAEAFKRNAKFLGMEPEDLGKTFVNGGLTYTVVGLRSGRCAKPLLCTSMGKSYVFRTDTVRVALGHRRPEQEVLQNLKWVHRDITRLMGNPVYLRSGGIKEIKELQREKALLIQELGRTPTLEEIAAAKTELDEVRD